MGGICARLRPECILLDPAESEKEGVVRRLVDLLVEVHGIADPDQLIAEILKREEMGSTCLGLGCALPHAHSDSLDSTVLAAARLTPARDFDAPDEDPVSLVFLLAGPTGNAGLHLRLLSKLARLLHDPVFREKLREAEDRDEFYSLVCQKDG